MFVIFPVVVSFFGRPHDSHPCPSMGSRRRRTLSTFVCVGEKKKKKKEVKKKNSTTASYTHSRQVGWKHPCKEARECVTSSGHFRCWWGRLENGRWLLVEGTLTGAALEGFGIKWDYLVSFFFFFFHSRGFFSFFFRLFFILFFFHSTVFRRRHSCLSAPSWEAPRFVEMIPAQHR